jgi:hypothetical protein
MKLILKNIKKERETEKTLIILYTSPDRRKQTDKQETVSLLWSLKETHMFMVRAYETKIGLPILLKKNSAVIPTRIIALGRRGPDVFDYYLDHRDAQKRVPNTNLYVFGLGAND